MAVGRFALPIAAGGAADPTEGTFIMGYSGGTSYQSGTMVSFDSVLRFINAKKWSKISIATTHMIGIWQGELWVEGLNTNGRIGLGNTTAYKELQRIGSDSDWTDCAAGFGICLAIRAGRLYGTGLNNVGDLGLGDTSPRTSFTQVGVDTDWTKVSTSVAASFSCAIKNGAIMSCGSNATFATGLNTSTGNTTSWTSASTAETFTEIVCGVSHAMAIGGGKIYSWGFNNVGRTAQNTTVGSTQIPTQSGSDTNWTKLACGNSHSAAIKSTGTLWTVGSGTNGRTGLNTTTQYSTWQQVGSATDWTDISIYTIATGGVSENTYAIKAGGLWVTGINSFGQLGVALSTASSNVFVQIGSETNHTRLAAGAGYVLTVRGTP